MSAQPAPPEGDVYAEAEALAECLVVLSERMLAHVARGESERLAALLQEHEAVRERLDPMIGAVRNAYDRLVGAGSPDAEPIAGTLSRLRTCLQRAYQANRALEAEATATCAALEAQLATHKQRSGAVLSYGAQNDVSGNAFTRVG